MELLNTLNNDRKPHTSHAHVVQELGKSIVGGIYPVGTIMPGDKELEERFNVSRTVLREAMKTLSAKGMVFARARVGTRVTERKQWNMLDADVLSWHFDSGLDEKFMFQLTEIRLAFEPFAAGLAAKNATNEDINQLFALAKEMGNQTHTTESFSLSDLKFHLAVLEASHNPFMQSVGSLIQAALTGVFRLSFPSDDKQEFDQVSHSHTQIVEAIKSRDPEAASEAMKEVILTGQEKVIEGLTDDQRPSNS